MKSETQERQSLLDRLNVRPKLILAFGAIAAMAGLCGVVGLYYVNRSAATVKQFTEITSPLLMESAALIENAQRTRSAFLSAVAKGEDIDQFARQLSDLRSQAAAHIAELRRLSAQADIDLQLGTIEQSGRAFSDVLAKTIAASARERTAAAAARERLVQYEADYKKLAPVLTSLADGAEGSIMKAEEQAKVDVQTRTATVEGLGGLISDTLNNTYPIVQYANRLLRELELIDDRIKLRSALSSPDQLPAVEQDLQRSFRVVESVMAKLKGRLQDAGARAAPATLKQGFADIEQTILGDGGLLENERATAAARAEIAGGRQSFDEIERGYFAVLNNAESAVRLLNQDARARTEAQVAQARAATAAGALITIVAGLLFSLFFAHRLTDPLIRMTAQVKNVRTSGELKVLPDASIAARSDELGVLSRNFNEMIVELAAARRELIARSEAEISKQYERLNLAINSMPQGLCMYDGDQKLIVSNRRYSEIYGLRPGQIAPGTSLHTMLEFGEAASIGDVNPGYFADERVRAITSGNPWHYVYELRDGRSIAVTHVPVATGGSIATHEDITERRKAEAKIAYMAHHDMLTDLPNRVQFRIDMQQALATLDEAPVAVLSIDLDYFKNVNDSLGHPAGDELLKAVARRLRSCLRAADKVARLGGDEFAIVQIGADQPAGSMTLAGRLIKEIGEPFAIDDHQIVIGASVGISLAPNDGRDADRLLKNADMALYRAKEDGRGTYRFFEPEMDARMQARRQLELDLRKALALGEFELLYQPLVRLETGTVSACEALLQWRHPQRGLVPPAEFIPVAEEIGLFNKIGVWELRTACIEAKRWPSHVRVAVNLSAVQFKSGMLVRDVTAALEAAGLPASRLELEITENVLLDETVSALETLNALRDIGVHISMDEFGTGYSSLGYLRKFPFDKIKINHSFVSDIESKADSMAIIRAVAGLSNTLGIVTTAEGVETQAQLRQLRREGCTEAQGGVFGALKTGAELERLWEQRPSGSLVGA